MAGWIARGEPAGRAAPPVRLAALTLTAAALLPAPRPAAAEDPPAAPLLVSGQAVERRLAAGERHEWQARACAGCFLAVVVEQHGCDVTLELVPGDGGAAVAVDSPSGRRGRERALVPGDGETAWTVQVASSATGGTGYYRLRIDEVPADAGDDGGGIEADLAWTAAAAAYLSDDSAAREAALRRLRDALPSLRRAADPRLAPEALALLSDLARRAGQDALAAELLSEAIAAWRQAGDDFGEAQALGAAAFGAWRAGRVDEALTGFGAALSRYRRLGDDYGAAQALNNLGHVHLHRGEPRPARERFLAALAAARRAAAPHLEATLLNNLGGTHEVLGELREALPYYDRARQRHAALGQTRDEARALVNHGAVQRSLGDYVAALGSYLAARRRFVAAGDAAGEATALNSIGAAYLAMGEPQRARIHLRQALRLRRAAGDRRGEAATLHNLARAARALDDPTTARNLLHLALALRRELDDPRGEATTLDQLGALELAAGEIEAAVASLGRALELRRRIGDPRREARTLRRLGLAEAAAGRPQRALTLLEDAVALQAGPTMDLERAESLHALAGVARALGRLDDAAAFLERALALLETRRPTLPDSDLESAFSAQHGAVYELAVLVAMERHRAAPAAGHHLRALELGERGRTHGLLALLADAEVEIERDAPPAPVARRAALRERLAAKAAGRAHLLGRASAAARVRALEAEIAELLVELDAVEGEIRSRSPRAAELTRPRPPSLRELQELLGPDTLLLEIALGGERSHLWAVTADEVTVHELPPRRWLEYLGRRLAAAWRRLDAGGGDDAVLAAELSATLLGPVAGHLDRRRLVVVPDGVLHHLPFAALPRPSEPDRGEPLLLRHEVVQLPSAGVLAALRRKPVATPPAGLLAVLADPAFAPSRGGTVPAWPALPWSRREAEAIAALAPSGAALLAVGDRASRELATGGRLGAYRFVHFATHGVLDDRQPALSGLALGAPAAGAAGDGFLGLHDVYALDLAADLVVLSGCETALGRELGGEGLVGLARGFLAAGAAGVAATLWSVQDRATAELMATFYRAMLGDGLPPAAALRTAQLRVRRDLRWRDPYFWAGFVLVGDWE